MSLMLPQQASNDVHIYLVFTFLWHLRYTEYQYKDGKTNAYLKKCLYFQYPFVSYLSRTIFPLAWHGSSFVDFPLIVHLSAFTISSLPYMCVFFFSLADLSKPSLLPHLYLTYTTCLPQSLASLGSVKPSGFAPHLWVRLAWPIQASCPFQHRPLSLNFSLNKFASYLARTDKLSF